MQNSSNLYDWDYRSLAKSFSSHSYPLIDAHCHINGKLSAALYLEAARLYGFGKAWSMSQLEEADNVREVLGDFVEFIAFPRIRGDDPIFDHGAGYIQRIEEFKKRGAKIMKLWCAPRIYDFTPGDFATHPMRIDSAVRRPTIDKAVELGMNLMIHISDPDAWFAHTYLDSRHYGNKLQQYELLEWLLSTYKVPTIAAHMGAFPEDLDFLDKLLSRYDHLYLDTSAAKWMLRELSKQPQKKRVEFFTKWSDRILFGTDIVTMDAHLVAEKHGNEMAQKASNQGEAFDLYASRFWGMRTLFENTETLKSPIVDPDAEGREVEITGIQLPEAVYKKIFAENALGFIQK